MKYMVREAIRNSDRGRDFDPAPQRRGIVSDCSFLKIGKIDDEVFRGIGIGNGKTLDSRRGEN